MSPYGVGGAHRHTPEIEQNLDRRREWAGTVSFTPTLAPMARASSRVHRPRRSRRHRRLVREAWREAYADEAFVHLLPEGGGRALPACWGATVHLQVVLDARVGRVVAMAAVDNLTKGTAGAAVQCMNLALGLPEGTGLPVAGWRREPDAVAPDGVPRATVDRGGCPVVTSRAATGRRARRQSDRRAQRDLGHLSHAAVPRGATEGPLRWSRWLVR